MAVVVILESPFTTVRCDTPDEAIEFLQRHRQVDTEVGRAVQWPQWSEPTTLGRPSGFNGFSEPDTLVPDTEENIPTRPTNTPPPPPTDAPPAPADEDSPLPKEAERGAEERDGLLPGDTLEAGGKQVRGYPRGRSEIVEQVRTMKGPLPDPVVMPTLTRRTPHIAPAQRSLAFRHPLTLGKTGAKFKAAAYRVIATMLVAQATAPLIELARALYGSSHGHFIQRVRELVDEMVRREMLESLGGGWCYRLGPNAPPLVIETRVSIEPGQAPAPEEAVE